MNSLEYKYIKGYNNKYYITREGKVYISDYLEDPKSTPNNRIQKIHKIHRLLAEHFISNPENKPCINHKDGNKLNNDLNNLEWATISENTKHAYANKLERNW